MAGDQHLERRQGGVLRVGHGEAVARGQPHSANLSAERPLHRGGQVGEELEGAGVRGQSCGLQASPEQDDRVAREHPHHRHAGNSEPAPTTIHGARRPPSTTPSASAGRTSRTVT